MKKYVVDTNILYDLAFYEGRSYNINDSLNMLSFQA